MPEDQVADEESVTFRELAFDQRFTLIRAARSLDGSDDELAEELREQTELGVAGEAFCAFVAELMLIAGKTGVSASLVAEFGQHLIDHAEHLARGDW